MNISVKQVLEPPDELTPERIADEDEFSGDIQGWLAEQSGRIADNVGIDGSEPPDSFWENELVLLVAFLGLFLLKWVEQGVSDSVARLRTVGLGIGEQVNIEAERWANRHALRMAKGLNKTTRQLAKQRIAVWLRTGQDKQALVDSLSEIISPTWRAEMIAQTEITRAYGEASRIVGERTEGVKTLRWGVFRDERLCPVCAPLEGVKQGKDGTFNGFRSPPAHPRCRCFLIMETSDPR